MSFVIENIRLKELVAITNANKPFHDELLEFLRGEGYLNLHAFVKEPSGERATAALAKYLGQASAAQLFDGLGRPYAQAKARWYLLAWILRDAPTQRLEPLLEKAKRDEMPAQRARLLNAIRAFVGPLFPNDESWTWPVIAEVMLARLEGSRRALKGALFEEIVRRLLEELFNKAKLSLKVGDKQVRIKDETYDVQVIGKKGSILVPIKTRETMGGGHAMLFTRDIYKSISVAQENGHKCIPIVVAESWGGDL